MNTRIKQLRKTLGLNQKEFGAAIGVSQGTVASYESGRRVPQAAVLLAICRTFNASEAWLTSGDGAMFAMQDGDTAIGEMISDTDNARRRLLTALSKLPIEQCEMLEQIVLAIANEIKKADP